MPMVDYMLECSGKETELLDCDFPGFVRDAGCDAGLVLCLLEPEAGNEGDLRLMNISVSEESNQVTGRLQVFRKEIPRCIEFETREEWDGS